jgi:hypothetical protein
VNLIGDIAGAPRTQAATAWEVMALRAASLGMSSAMMDDAIERGTMNVNRAVKWCETPIEARLLPWLIFADYGPLVLTIPAGVHSPKVEPLMCEGDCVIVPQFAFARFRLDFAVVTRINNTLRMVCVECDGDGYHNAQDDNARDDYLAQWCIPTIRASGKDIYRSPQAVARNVAAAVQDQLAGL